MTERDHVSAKGLSAVRREEHYAFKYQRGQLGRNNDEQLVNDNYLTSKQFAKIFLRKIKELLCMLPSSEDPNSLLPSVVITACARFDSLFAPEVEQNPMCSETAAAINATLPEGFSL